MRLVWNGILSVTLLITVGCGQNNDSTSVGVKGNPVAKKRTQPKRPRNAVKAPDFTLATVDGEWVSMKDFEGKVILLNFWGTWCPPCRQEIPDFVKLYEKHNADGLEIIGITLTSGSPAEIAEFMEKYNMNYVVLTDIKGNETQKITTIYGQITGKPITGIPTTYLIDRDGYIVKTYVGPRTEEIFYKDIKPYL